MQIALCMCRSAAENGFAHINSHVEALRSNMTSLINQRTVISVPSCSRHVTTADYNPDEAARFDLQSPEFYRVRLPSQQTRSLAEGAEDVFADGVSKWSATRL